MNTKVAVLLLLFYLSVVFHEVAHLISFRNRGLKVREFGIGIKKGPCFSYIPKTGKFKGIRFAFYPATFFLGAFVEVDEKVMDLPYRERALAFCSGPFANIHFGCLLYILLFASVFVPGVHAYDTSNWNILDWMSCIWHFAISSSCLYVPLLAIPTLWFGRRYISSYLGPVLGILLIVAHFYTASVSLSAVEYVSEITGPVGFVADLPSMAQDMWSAVEWAAQLSLGLAVLNLLPIPPLDGGCVILPTVKKYFPRFGLWYQKAGFAFIVIIMLLAFAKDIVHYVGYLGLALVVLISILFYLLSKAHSALPKAST
ncbi:MAG: M50 family metallopeptidase [Candidatus Paceibacterota bacterium]|jgi:membrane-associated protease RseP (regulator of RpoE activity)|nr:M50 family metallopeptidase [Candidatus Paceibacterota bacterium]